MPIPDFNSNGQKISGDPFLPSSGSQWPSVVIAYGTEGMNPPFDALIRDFGKRLADNGILAFIPHFFEATGTAPGMEAVFAPKNAPERFNRWVEVLQDAITYVQTLANDPAGHSGHVGFSLGAHLALRAAAGSTVKAVVDFFGPMTTIGSSISADIVAKLPPTLIHHGKQDDVVKFGESETLDKWLKDKSIQHSFDPNAYPIDGHPGQKKLSDLRPTMFRPSDWSPGSQASATTQSVSFLKKWL